MKYRCLETLKKVFQDTKERRTQAHFARPSRRTTPLDLNQK